MAAPVKKAKNRIRKLKKLYEKYPSGRVYHQILYWQDKYARLKQSELSLNER